MGDTVMNYQKLMRKQQAEFGELPVFWAFSNDGLARGLKKINAQPHELVALGAGGYMKKADLPLMESLLARHRQETAAAMQDDDFAVSALVYELQNHEFSFTGDLQPALDAIGVEVRPDIIKKALDFCQR